jgi:spermidine/putrescine transport system ATP-binding protein
MSGFLVFDNVHKHFGSTRAVDGVTLDIAKGKTFSLLGPSGCGKTTLLRLAAGFERPDQGRILLDGEDITHLPPERRPVNTVFQNYALFPHLSVWENVAFGLRIAKRSRAEIAREVEAMLTLTRLTEHARKRPSQLSGGQKQRVAIARALVNRPRVLLLDEPLAALDLKLRQHMLEELKRLHEEVGITFIYVTHDQEEALGVSDRIAVMHQGRLAQVGSPAELYERPQGRFVASFLGDASFLPGEVQSVEQGLHIVRVEGVGEFRLRNGKTFPAGTEVEVSLRPERVRLSLERPLESAAGISFPATVTESTYLGRSAKVQAVAAGHPISIEVTYDEVGGALSGLAKGTPVWLEVRHADALLLEKEDSAS